ncbi:MAG: polysaccharide pyruvyl transferase CsaB [Clostridia bacterium]|nr:polysaccharide pyruvyl transferase CsaB [Clostridia bacterium]
MKILMTLMGLEIGGAETHVVELSKALKKMGHDITVASNGGVYVPELENFGIKHVKLPLHSKAPQCVLKSYNGLKKLCRQESFDIVHAHARIPAFICGLLARRFDFRFVTSAHWVFKITPLWKRIANWGERTIAVSDDIKQYLIDNYGLYPDNISVTINGIDSEKFSKDTDTSSVEEEFGISRDDYNIVYISRIDEDRSAVAYLVASAMPDLLKINPKARLIIVGGGNDLERLTAHVKEINSSIGEGVIKLTGARIDINKFVALSDAFVGVSRSALEAMAAGVPVVIAGNEGYIGIFGEDKFKISYDTNYCCRGCIMPTVELIRSDLEKIMTASEEEIQRISDYNKSTIENYYSARRMAQDYLNMYKLLTPYRHYRHPEVLISGYYGFRNVGDDALLQIIIESIKDIRPDTRITVLSSNPKETRKRYLVNSVNRYNPIAVINEMRHTKLFISGGGSLLQDETSTKSLVYYVSLISLAKRLNKKVMIWANGFGPISEANTDLVLDALRGVDAITLREPNSAKLLFKLAPEIKADVTADPAFCIEGAEERWVKKLCDRYGIEQGRDYFAVSLRDWKDTTPDLEKNIAYTCRFIMDKYSITPVFVAMQNSRDLEISLKIRSLLGVEAPLVVDATAKELVTLMQNMRFVIGMRLHFLIFSANAYTPAIGLSYDPKIDSLLEYIGLDCTLSVKDFTSDALIEKCEEIIAKRDEISEKLKEQKATLSEMARKDAQTAVNLLK